MLQNYGMLCVLITPLLHVHASDPPGGSSVTLHRAAVTQYYYYLSVHHQKTLQIKTVYLNGTYNSCILPSTLSHKHID